MAGSHPSAVSKGAPQEGQGKEDRVPGKRGVTASVNSTAIFGARHAHSGRGGGGGVWGAAFCRYGDGPPPHKFAVWKKSGGLAGGTQERGTAPTARSAETTQASACSDCLGVGVHFIRTAVSACLYFGLGHV